MSIIIDRVSCRKEEAPVEGAEFAKYISDDEEQTYEVWLLDITVEEAVKSFGRCIVSYNQDLELFTVTIYDGYVE